MSSDTIYKHLLTRLFPVDFAISVSITVSWFMTLDVVSVGGSVLLAACTFVVHVLIWALGLYTTMAPLRRWDRRGTQCDDSELIAADRAANGVPGRFAAIYTLAWVSYFGGVTALAWFLFPELLSFGRSELGASAIAMIAVSFAAPVLVFSLTRLLLEDTQAALGVELERRSLGGSRVHVPLAPRLALIAVGLTVGPAGWQASTTWIALGDGARASTLIEQRNAATWAARDLAEGRQLSDADHEVVAAAQLPPMLSLGDHSVLGDVASFVDVRNEAVTAAAAVGDGRWVVARAPVPTDRGQFWAALATFGVALVFFALLSITATTRSLFTPLGRLDRAVRRIAEVGDLGEFGRIPVVRSDEVGGLTRNFNIMLDGFEHLTTAARAVSAGDLRVEVRGRGDLQDAFRAMVEHLNELVGQIRDAAIEVASASAEIHLTIQAQETAATHQSEGIGEVSGAVQSLAESAGDISRSVHDVLDNAEQTRDRADEVVAKIADLGGHVSRVGELLEVIREVGDRSDLLALNGSLEATRAGEAGRGFALVAGEMRRLAERVTGTVADVRALMTDIDASNSATVEATQRSRALAENTANAARSIAEVTMGQSTQSELVSSNVDELAGFVLQVAATTTQTRGAVADLRRQAELLERLIERFEVRAAGPRE